MKTINYIVEPVLNTELILVNNAKKLKLDINLKHEIHIDRIESLSKEYINLEQLSSNGQLGLQKQKREIRDELRKLASETYTDRDTNLFGQMIVLIIERIATRPQFSNYTFKDEMKSLATEHILLYTNKFDSFRQSIITGQYVSSFTYISTIAFNAFIATINKHKKNQTKAKEEFLETQKLIHRDPNRSKIGPEFENAERKIVFVKLEKNELYKKLHEITIEESTEFWIPKDYKITEKEYNFVMSYYWNISIRRNET